MSTISLLCENLSQVDQPTNLGLLPLHCAASRGKTDSLRVLLRHDINMLHRHETIDTQNILGLTPLHAAIMKGKLAAAVLLLKAGANQEIRSRRNLSPLHYALMNKKSRKFFYPLETVPSIVWQHYFPATREDNPEHSVDFNQTFNSFGILGKIIPSLQQVRTRNEKTSYGGYYALYNALSLIKFNTEHSKNKLLRLTKIELFEQYDRRKFCAFFERALDETARQGKRGKLGVLSAKELRHLINTFCPDEPIVVLEKRALKQMAEKKLQEEALELSKDDSGLKKLRMFAQGN